MAKTKGKGSLKDRIERENARAESRTAAPKAPGAGGAPLPAGIEDGVAKLTRVDFDVIENGDYAGEQRFYCHGTCVLPKTHDGVTVEGRLVQPVMIKLCDVKSNFGDSSFAENVAKAENRLKLLGFPTEDFEDLEDDTLNYFKTGDPMYFNFRTWKPDDSDRVIVQIVGPAEPPSEDDSDEIQDDTEAEAVQEETPAESPKAEGPDLDDLAQKADGGDEKAQLAIVAEAEKLSIDPEAEEYDNWTSVVEAIKAGGEGESDVTPEVGDVFSYVPSSDEGSKDCEVTAVSSGDKTVALKSLEDNKEYESVGWGRLNPIA